MGDRRRIGALAIGAMAVLTLTGCAEPMAATPVAPSRSASATPSTTATAGPGDAPVWSTASACAAISVITSTIGDADDDRAAGRISKKQRAAILSTAGTSFRLVQIGIRDEGPLAADVDAIVAATPEKPKASAAGLDTSSTVYIGALHRLAGTCRAAGATLSGLSTYGG